MTEEIDSGKDGASAGRVRGLLHWLSGKIAHNLGEHMEEVLSGAIITLAVKVVGVSLMFGFSVIVARLLGVEGAGAFFLTLTVIQMCAVIARWGLDNAALRFVAANAAQNRWNAVRGVYRTAVTLAGLFSIVVGVGVFFAATPLAQVVFHKPDLARPLQIAAVCVPALTLLWIHSEALKGLKHMLSSQALTSLILPVGALVVVAFTARRWGAAGAVGAYAVGAYVALIAGVLFWKRHTGEAVSGEVTFFSIRKILKAARPLGAVAVTNLVVQWLPLLILGAFGTKAEVGIFGAVVRIATLASFVLLAINSMVAPTFATLWANGDRKGLEHTAVKSAAVVTLVTAPMLAVLVIFPEWMLSLFGEGFEAGSLALIILALAQFVNALTGSVGYLLMMTGNERYLWWAVSGAALLCIMLSALIPLLDHMLMAAVAVAASLIAQKLLATFFAWRTLGIIPCRYTLLWRWWVLSKGKA